MVGTTALFLQDVSGMNELQGQGRRRPPASPTSPSCRPSSRSSARRSRSRRCRPASSCPYSGTGPRTFDVGYTQYDYYFKKFGATALHGVFVIPKDLPSTIAATMPIFRAENKMGIKSDKEFGESGTSTQPEYTQVAPAMKTNNSDVRAQRPRLQGHRAHAQGSAGAGCQHASRSGTARCSATTSA